MSSLYVENGLTSFNVHMEKEFLLRHQTMAEWTSTETRPTNLGCLPLIVHSRIVMEVSSL